MNNQTFLFLLFSFLILSACQMKNPAHKINSNLTTTDSLKIVQEVIQSTTDWANASNKLDAKRVSEFWMNSPELIFVEDINKFPDFQSFQTECVKFYSTPIDTINMVWLKRNILPITENMASIYGRYEFYCKFSTGEIVHEIPYFTALMTKDGKKWKVLRGHESNQTSNIYN